ncbi:MAG: helix-turn-helix transcriptional regulator [Candidatus Dadabacteria bacterium]|nr:helix-turn-helix transcriptional regulator [Candidatus Dadabacteria bacterium]
MEEARNQIDRIVSKLGEKIKALRKDTGLSLKDLSRRSGISAAAIHKIESNGIMPTITTMMKIADSLGKKVSYFIEEESENNDAFFVPYSKRESILTFKKGLTLQGISAKKYGDFIMTAACAVVDVGASSGTKPMSHRGEELVCCLQGKMEFRLKDITHLLGPGDSLHFRTHLEHSWKNVGDVPAKLIWILAIAPS